MIMLSIVGNKNDLELFFHLCQVEVENHHNSAFIKGVKEKRIGYKIFNYFTLFLEILGISNSTL